MTLVGFEDRHECLWLHDSRFAKYCELGGCVVSDAAEAGMCMPMIEFSDELDSEHTRIEFLTFRK